MELPECHDAALEKADAFGGLFRDKLAIYLSALKEQGLMREAHQYSYAKGKFWEATTLLEDHNALIIRMEQK